MKFLLAAATVAIAGATVTGSHAADVYPDKPVRLISQFAPGGTTDIIARLIAPRLSEILGQPVIVENKAGAAGNIGADYVAKSKPDGYTLLVANNVIVTNPAIQKVPFNVEKDFSPIVLLGTIPIVLAVHPSVPAGNAKELMALVKSSPGKYSYSSCGSGTAQHLAGELFKQQANLDLVHVSYKGCSPALVDGLSGQLPIMFNAMSNVKPYVQGGQLKILAIASAQRSAGDQNIQTIAEAGIKDFDAQVWFGLLAPGNTPVAIVSKLQDTVSRIMQMPDVQEKLKTISFDVKVAQGKDFSRLISSDLKKWSLLVKQSKIDFTQ